MSRRFERPSRVLSLLVCLLGFGLVPWAGCEKSESGESEPAETDQQETSSEPAEEESSTTTSERTSESPPASAASTGSVEVSGSGNKSRMSGGETSGSSEKLSKAELEKFARVAELLAPKRNELMKVIDEAETAAEKEKAQKKLKQEARQAAKQAGLSVKRFHAIARRMKRDPSLKRRIREIMAERARAAGK